MKYFSNSGIGQDRHELNSNPAMETVALLETVEKQTAVFPPFPQRLENSPKSGQVFHSSHSRYC
jgi:hypothetical protein